MAQELIVRSISKIANCRKIILGIVVWFIVLILPKVFYLNISGKPFPAACIPVRMLILCIATKRRMQCEYSTGAEAIEAVERWQLLRSRWSVLIEWLSRYR